MAMTLITTNTESGDATSSFTSSIDSTYKLYIFKFIDLHPETDNMDFLFQGNAAGGSGFNETITSTSFYASHNEADDDSALSYDATRDQAQGTAYQILFGRIGNANDESAVGELYLFNPSNTTYVKHWYFKGSTYHGSAYLFNYFSAGYFNTTSAIDEISFKLESGNMNGTIKMYGVG